MVTITTVFLPQLSDVCCVNYHLFTRKLSGIFSHFSFPMVKVTTIFVSKLLGLWLECYRDIYRNYRRPGSTNFFPMIKVITMLFPKLSRLQCLWPCYLHIMYCVVYKRYHVGDASFIVVVMRIYHGKSLCAGFDRWNKSFSVLKY